MSTEKAENNVALYFAFCAVHVALYFTFCAVLIIAMAMASRLQACLDKGFPPAECRNSK